MKSAIIGCGRIAPVHARALEKMADAQLVACADIDQEKARAFAGEYGITAFTDYREMLDSLPLDVVHICTPHHLHVEMAEDALSRGIHVLLEKPGAISREGFHRLVAAQ